jgi:putative endonuclease
MNILRRFHPNSPTGNRGEDVAVDFLKGAGFRILERNYKNKLGRALGEIDIVARDGDELVFVEVKAREVKPGKQAFPEESITSSKLRKLARIAEGYLRERRREAVPYRFDAILIVFQEGIAPEIRHFRSIFM